MADYYYNAENLRRFFVSPAEMEEANEPEQYAASTRLLAEIFRTMRERYPGSAPLLDRCDTDEHPLGMLWRDETWGAAAKALMVEMGLLLPVPTHIADALRDADEYP